MVVSRTLWLTTGKERPLYAHLVFLSAIGRALLFYFSPGGENVEERDAMKEALRQYWKQYYGDNKERIKANQKAYYERKKQRLKEERENGTSK